MTALHGLDLLAMGIYFIVLIGIGLRVARSEKEGGDSESFLAADRNMNLLQTTASTAATDIGGGFSIAMGGLGFTLGIAGSWFIAISGLSIIIVSFFMVPKVKRWADAVKGLTTGDLFEARFDRRTGTIAAVVIGLAWFTFVGGQIIAGAKLVQVTMGVDLTLAVIASGAIVLAYTAMGGLKAVIFTDVFQMVVLMVGIVFIAVPIGLIEVGGWEGIVAHFESDPETASMVEWGAAGWGTIAEWFFAVFPVWFISIAGDAAHHRCPGRKNCTPKLPPHRCAYRVATFCYRQHVNRHDCADVTARNHRPRDGYSHDHLRATAIRNCRYCDRSVCGSGNVLC